MRVTDAVAAYDVDIKHIDARDLRISDSEALYRVEHGETLIVTRDGRPVAELGPLRRASASPAELIARRRNLPHVDPTGLRADLDALIDPV